MISPCNPAIIIAVRRSLLSLAVAAAVALQAAPGKLEVKYIDVGQGDAVFIRCPEEKHNLLIDSGDNKYPQSKKNFQQFLRDELKTNGAPLHLVVASHPHSDHIASMLWVLTNYDVGTYVDCGFKHETDMFGFLDVERRAQVDAGKILYIKGRDSSFDEIDICPRLTIRLIQPSAQASLSHMNDRSVAVRIDFGTNSFLFVGDLEKHAENVMLNQFTDSEKERLDVDVLKVGHHGSDTSSTANFVLAASPKIAVISCGKKETGTNERYKHPRLSTVRTYGDWFKLNPPAPELAAPAGKVFAYDADLKKWRQTTRPAGLWVTTKDGTITIRSDGTNMEIERSEQ